MNKKQFFKKIKLCDLEFAKQINHGYELPKYDPKTHYLEITKSKYFKALTVLRHNIKKVSDFYWSEIQGAYNVDLFMITSSVSSPMGPGSNSEAIPIKFGKYTLNYETPQSRFSTCVPKIHQFSDFLIFNINKTKSKIRN